MLSFFLRSSKNNKRAFGSFVVFAGLFILYATLAWLARGGEVWWYVDIASGGNVFWGDDAYRFFLARGAFSNPDVWFFNFVLPLALLLDGILVLLSGYDQFLVRIFKALLLSLSWWFSYRACLRVSATRFALMASLLIYTLPLLMYVGMSFFAESWFILVASLAVYCWVSERRYLSAFLISLLPLIRIEGIYAVLAFSFYGLYLRDYRLFLMPYITGGLYFLLIIAIGPGVPSFLLWRVGMGQVYLDTGRWYGGDMGRFWGVFGTVTLLASLLGLWIKPNLRVLLLTFVSIIAVIMGVGLAALSNLEPRYLLMGLVFLPPGLAVFLGSLGPWMHRISLGKLATPLLILLVTMMASFNVTSLHVFSELRQYVFSNFSLPDEVRAKPLSLETYFRNMSPEKVASYDYLADRVHEALAEHRDIKTVIVSNFLVFYFLDPRLIPDDVTVVYALFGRRTLDPIMGKSLSAAYFSRQPYFSYFSLEPPEQGRDLILYVDIVPLPEYPFRWIIKGHELSIFSGSMVAPEDLEQWRHRPFGVAP